MHPGWVGGVLFLFCYNSHGVRGVNNYSTFSRLLEWVRSVNIIVLCALREFSGTLMVLSRSSETLSMT